MAGFKPKAPKPTSFAPKKAAPKATSGSPKIKTSFAKPKRPKKY